MEIDALGNQIRRELRNLREGFVVLFITPAEAYLSATLTFLDYAINEAYIKGVYVTASRPYLSLLRMFEDKGISLDGVSFIDCISAMAGEKTGRKVVQLSGLQGPKD